MADPKNFDELYNGNRTFVLGGQTFHWEPLHWRVWGEVIDARSAEEEAKEKKLREVVKKLMEGGVSEEQAELEAELEADPTTLTQTYENLVDRCVIFVAEAERDAFKALVSDVDKKITIAQIQSLVVWLQEVQTPDRPTDTQTASSPGAGSTGATSPAS